MFTPDSYQQAVIEAQSGCHLVLAPPGCGKTQILTERIRYAHNHLGVKYEDMLCLTFTNRAARGMKERIKANIDDREVENVYVGNVHRFCSRFLFDNALIPADTSVIDDDDAVSILARHLNTEEAYVNSNYNLKKGCFDAVHLSAYMYQIEHRHPKEIRIHPESLPKEDISVLIALCSACKKEFNLDNLLGIYKHPESYEEMLQYGEFDLGLVKATLPILKKMKAALYYSDYKADNRLIDFEDLLLLTYDALINAGGETVYPWVQVDEVQDLNPLQLKIIDLLSVDYFPQGNYVYLGDEQQAIFSFMGAKMSTLEILKERCQGNIHKLAKNHRSPKYLMQVFNYYAFYVLNIARDMLPTSDSVPIRVGNELSLLASNTLDNEYLDVAQQAKRMSEENDNISNTSLPLDGGVKRGATTAVIVISNADADMVSSRMTDLGISHFKVSGTDMFSLPDVKLLLAHLSIFANEHNFIAWARILKGMRVYEQSASARRFVRELIDRAMLPTDLMQGKSYVMDFADTCGNPDREYVVFDTETTGLNVLEDDIIQIAAVKMKGGEVIANSEFKVFILTDRDIPRKLGDIDNPIIGEMEHNTLYKHAEALRMFLDYIGDDVLVGHNVEYDYNILDNNLKRYLPEINLRDKCPYCFDTLKLTRLLEPDLHQYKLKHLLEVLHLAGENSHLADADVAATCNVIKHCLKKVVEIIPQQREFLSQKVTKERQELLRRNYEQYYLDTKKRLYEKSQNANVHAIVSELERMYKELKEENYIKEIKGFRYLLRYIEKELVDINNEPTLRDQIANHVLEMCTLKESDLCSAEVVDERVFVTTVHKAKGLEFDNVIVFDVADDRYPSFFAKDDDMLCAEDARKLYVAMTRAKKRLMLAVGAVKHDYHGMPHSRNLSRFLNPILRFFTTVSPDSEMPK